MTSVTLLERARANQPGAWERMVGLYAPLVKYWCRMAGLPPSDYDDIVQDVFLAAATGLTRFRREQPRDSFRGWLRGITRNVLLAHYRRSHREPVGEGGTDSLRQIHALADPHFRIPDEDPPEQTQAIYHRALELVRHEFEDRTWRMFWMVAVENQPVSTVAEHFGVTSAAVRKAKSRILFRLKQEVADVI